MQVREWECGAGPLEAAGRPDCGWEGGLEWWLSNQAEGPAGRCVAHVPGGTCLSIISHFAHMPVLHSVLTFPRFVLHLAQVPGPPALQAIPTFKPGRHLIRQRCAGSIRSAPPAVPVKHTEERCWAALQRCFRPVERALGARHILRSKVSWPGGRAEWWAGVRQLEVRATWGEHKGPRSGLSRAPLLHAPVAARPLPPPPCPSLPTLPPTYPTGLAAPAPGLPTSISHPSPHLASLALALVVPPRARDDAALEAQLIRGGSHGGLLAGGVCDLWQGEEGLWERKRSGWGVPRRWQWREKWLHGCVEWAGAEGAGRRLMGRCPWQSNTEQGQAEQGGQGMHGRGGVR